MEQPTTEHGPGVLKRAWASWLRFARFVGTVQMIIILSLMYWTVVMLVAVPFRFLADPLASRQPDGSRWVNRDPIPDVLESMKNQF